MNLEGLTLKLVTDNLIEQLEAEGAEVLSPDFMGFVKYVVIGTYNNSKFTK